MLEDFKRYFETFDVVYIQDSCGSSEILPIFQKICPKFREYRLYDPALFSNVLEMHLIVFEVPRPIEDDVTKIREMLSHANYWECLILSDEYRVHSLSRLALSHSILDILPRKLKESDIEKLVKFLLGRLVNHRKERFMQEYQRRILERADHFYFLRRDGHTLFINPTLQKFCGVKSASEIDTLDSEDIPLLGKFREYQGAGCKMWQDPRNRDTFLIDVGAEDENGAVLGSCFRIDPNFYHERAHEPLSRIRFTEIFKNRLVANNANDEHLFIMCVKIENRQKILDDYGLLAYHEFSKEFIEYCTRFVGEEQPIYSFWRHDLLLFLLFSQDVVEIKRRTMGFFSALSSHEFSQGIVSFVELAVIDFLYLEPNNALLFLEQFYEKSYSPREGKRIVVRFSSAVQGEGGEAHQVMFYLEMIHNKEQVIRVLNLYKGLSMRANTKILKIQDGDIYIKAEKTQRYLMNLEKKVIIESADLPGDISADVKYVDRERPFAIIKNPSFIEFSVNHRQYVRVECDVRIPITLSSGRYAYTGEILDLSIQAIAIRYRSMISKNILQSPVKLSFALPNVSFENSLAKLTVNGKVMAIKPDEEQGTRVVVMIKPKSPEDGYLLEYIYARQKELMREIKHVGGTTFK
ncbi:MAG: PilZ domain-containing protein [Wolinella sp.]